MEVEVKMSVTQSGNNTINNAAIKSSRNGISVRVNENGHIPIGFTMRGREHQVSAVQDLWRMMGRWWDGDSEKTYFRIVTVTGGIYELCLNSKDDSWSVSRVED